MFDSVRQSLTVSGTANQDLEMPSTGPMNAPPELSSIDPLNSRAELHQIQPEVLPVVEANLIKKMDESSEDAPMLERNS